MRLTRFADAMAQELDNNRHKGGWQRSSAFYLLKRLREEIEELENAAYTGTGDEVLSEAADVANFAYMLADKYEGATRDRQGKEKP